MIRKEKWNAQTEDSGLKMLAANCDRRSRRAERKKNPPFAAGAKSREKIGG
jgi:hypothetical protein